MRILSVDRGSSSLKIAAYDVGPDAERLICAGEAERLGQPDAPPDAVRSLAQNLGVGAIEAVGHRIVFGGASREAPALVTPELLTGLAELEAFDPLHLPAALQGIREAGVAWPGLPQVACFDTAFHQTMPPVAHRLPVPRELWAEGVRRYGFHGLSYESIVRKLGPAGARGRMIVAHLGNGASLAAMRDGRPVDTTMGFSPLGGLMMGTRPGDLDPGVMLYLLRTNRYSLAELSDALTERSGMAGVSHVSGDMRALLERRSTEAAAAEAVELFVYQAQKHLGALYAVLGGLDTLVFTGGIGERAAPVRWEIAGGLRHFGIELDSARNDAAAAVISATGAPVVVRVMQTEENLMVARHTYAMVTGTRA